MRRGRLVVFVLPNDGAQPRLMPATGRGGGRATGSSVGCSNWAGAFTARAATAPHEARCATQPRASEKHRPRQGRTTAAAKNFRVSGTAATVRWAKAFGDTFQLERPADATPCVPTAPKRAAAISARYAPVAFGGEECIASTITPSISMRNKHLTCFLDDSTLLTIVPKSTKHDGRTDRSA